MLTASFDASGQESNQPFVVVAGFISSTEDWSEFTQRWMERIQRDKILSFHAAACENNTDEFWAWKDKRIEKIKLKEDLIEIIQSCTHRLFTSTVEMKSLATLSHENRLQYGLRAYALAGRTCAARVREWSSSWGSRYVPELVFEQGDPGSKGLEIRLLEDGFSQPNFRPTRDKKTKGELIIPGFIPLQAADFLAYEVFLAHKTLSDSRWELRGLLRKPGPLGTYTINSLNELDQILSLRSEELRKQDRSER
jgi:hypothetical protein